MPDLKCQSPNIIKNFRITGVEGIIIEKFTLSEGGGVYRFEREKGEAATLSALF